MSIETHLISSGILVVLNQNEAQANCMLPPWGDNPMTDIEPLIAHHQPDAVSINCSRPEAVAAPLDLIGLHQKFDPSHPLNEA